jgi:hypothetical protein
MSNFLSLDQWDRQLDAEKEAQRKKREEYDRKCRQSRMKNETDFREKFGDYWYSEEIDTWIRVGVYGYRALDKVNGCGVMHYDLKDVKQSTFMTAVAPGPGIVPYTIEEYHNKFCSYDENDKRWILN